MLKKFLLLISVFLCTSCIPGSIYEPEPVSFGKDPAELKVSPCACMPVEMLPGLPEWLTEAAV
ncbi:MAG: hypothetical protein AB7U85_03675 [Alphaproteobacteria bacterium]